MSKFIKLVVLLTLDGKEKNDVYTVAQFKKLLKKAEVNMFDQWDKDGTAKIPLRNGKTAIVVLRQIGAGSVK